MLINKDVLADIIAEKHELSKAKSRRIVDDLFDTISEFIANNEEVSIYSFGKFIRRHRPERKGFNPSTQESIIIEEDYIPVFEPSKVLRDLINEKSDLN